MESGFWMLIAFLLSKTVHKFLAPFALLSILCYSIGFILAMLRLRKL